METVGNIAKVIPLGLESSKYCSSSSLVEWLTGNGCVKGGFVYGKNRTLNLILIQTVSCSGAGLMTQMCQGRNSNLLTSPLQVIWS